jgi:hypothetical protein
MTIAKDRVSIFTFPRFREDHCASLADSKSMRTSWQKTHLHTAAARQGRWHVCRKLYRALDLSGLHSKSLGATERAMYLDIAARYAGYGSNNGKIGYSVREAATNLHVGTSTAKIR